MDYTSQNHKNTNQKGGGGLNTKIAARKCLGATCVLFIIVPNNYTFTLVNVNVDKKKNPFVTGYYHNSDHAALKK